MLTVAKICTIALLRQECKSYQRYLGFSNLFSAANCKPPEILASTSANDMLQFPSSPQTLPGLMLRVDSGASGSAILILAS
jgi:hypothetical protein